MPLKFGFTSRLISIHFPPKNPIFTLSILGYAGGGEDGGPYGVYYPSTNGLTTNPGPPLALLPTIAVSQDWMTETNGNGTYIGDLFGAANTLYIVFNVQGYLTVEGFPPDQPRPASLTFNLAIGHNKTQFSGPSQLSVQAALWATQPVASENDALALTGYPNAYLKGVDPKGAALTPLGFAALPSVTGAHTLKASINLKTWALTLQ